MNTNGSFSITENMWLSGDELPDGFVGFSIDPQMLRAEDGLPTTGYLRLDAILTIFPVSKTTWYDGIKKGIFPAPVKKFGPKIAAWHVDDIRQVMKRVA